VAARGQFRPPYQSALALGAWAWENRSFIEGKVALSGGDPDELTLRRFLDISYALLVDEYQRIGMNLVAVGILVFVAASAGRTIARINTSGSERRSLFIVRETLLVRSA